jgi:hypothetical protein
MRPLCPVLITIIFCAALASSVAAQTPSTTQSTSDEVFGSVTKGDTTIVFEPANSDDLNTQALVTWDNFATAHSSIARALAYKPSLMNDPAYLKKHPELSELFQEHPEVREAMASDPGNFAAIPPRPGE